MYINPKLLVDVMPRKRRRYDEERNAESPRSLARSAATGGEIEVPEWLLGQVEVLGHPEKRVRSRAVSGLVDGYLHMFKKQTDLELVKDALEQRLWVEGDPCLVQQLVHVLASLSMMWSGRETDAAISSMVVVLERYYLSLRCSDAIKLHILSSLCRISGLIGYPKLDIVKTTVSKQLRQSNPRVRKWALKLLAASEHQLDNSMTSILRDCFRDPHECVRGAALDAAISLSKKGQSLIDGFNGIALQLLQDVSESIRLSSIHLLGLWVLEVEGLERDHTLSRQMDRTYIQVCTMMTDICMQARKQACQVLGTMESVSERVMLHSLSKKSEMRALDSAIKDKHGLPFICCSEDDDGNDSKISSGNAAGAFVHALEDEFHEVRLAAIQALVNLSLRSKKMMDGATELLLDMLNDQNVSVRKDTIQALLQIVMSGSFSVQEKHLQMICSILEDSNNELRSSGRKLLSFMALPTLPIFKEAIQALLRSLNQHHEDGKDILESLQCLGKTHGSHVEGLVRDLSDQIKVLTYGDAGLDDPGLEALLTLCLAAVPSNKNIVALLPWKLLSDSRFANLSLPPVIHPRSVAPGSILFSTAEQKFGQRKLSVDRKAAKEDELTANLSPVRGIVEHVIRCAVGVEPLLKTNACEEALKVLSGCRRGLKELKSGAFVNLASLYVECLLLVVKLSKGKNGGITSNSWYRLHDRLGLVLGQMRNCFSGFTANGFVQMLELDAFYFVAGLSAPEADIDLVRCNSELSSIVTESYDILSSENPSQAGTFSLLRAVEKHLDISWDKETIKAMVDAAGTFWPRHNLVCGDVEETRAELKLPASNFEHPLRFVSGFPFQFTVAGVVYSVPSSSRIWVRLRFEEFSCQYRFMDLKKKEMAVDFEEQLELYDMPSSVRGVLRICIMVESTKLDLGCVRGPQGSLFPISSEELMYLHVNCQ